MGHRGTVRHSWRLQIRTYVSKNDFHGTQSRYNSFAKAPIQVKTYNSNKISRAMTLDTLCDPSIWFELIEKHRSQFAVSIFICFVKFSHSALSCNLTPGNLWEGQMKRLSRANTSRIEDQKPGSYLNDVGIKSQTASMQCPSFDFRLCHNIVISRSIHLQVR